MAAAAPTVVRVTKLEVGRPDAAGACAPAGEVAPSFRSALAVGDRIGPAFAYETPHGLMGRDAPRPALSRAGGAVELRPDADGAPAGYGWGRQPATAAFPFAAPGRLLI